MPTEAKDGTTTKRLSSPLQMAKESIRAESLSSGFLHRCHHPPTQKGMKNSEETQWMKLNGACSLYLLFVPCSFMRFFNSYSSRNGKTAKLPFSMDMGW